MAVGTGQRVRGAAGKFFESLIDDLVEFAKARFRLPKNADPPDELPSLQYLLDWFWELNATRQIAFDAGPIAFHEIKAWSDLKRIDIGPAEVAALRRLDVEYRRPEEAEPISIVKSLSTLKAAHDADKKPQRKPRGAVKNG